MAQSQGQIMASGSLKRFKFGFFLKRFELGFQVLTTFQAVPSSLG